MTAPTLSLTEAQTLQALGTVLTAILPPTIGIIRGQINRIPEPGGADFVVMTPILRKRLGTNLDTYSDGYPSDPSVMNALAPTQVTIQLDVHGPCSADNGQIITTLFRDDYGVQQFAQTGFDVTPLYCGDPRQMPYENENQQIEERYVIDAVMQCNPVIAVPQQFADQLKPNLYEVEVVYPL